MKDKKVLLIRYGAFGDHVHCSNVIKAFDEEGWHISFEYNYKGTQIHKLNPRIDCHIHFDPYEESFKEHWKKHPNALKEHISSHYDYFDKVVTFQDTLENALIEPESKSSYFWPLYRRRAKNTNICYYDQSMKAAGFTDDKYMGWTGEIYFTHEEHERVGKFMQEKHGDHYVILWALRGSMYQKAMYPWAQEVCNAFLDRHPEAWIITTGDEMCQKMEWEHPRVTHYSGRVPYRQVLRLSKYVDMVVTPETGLGIGAGAYGTPKIMLMTAASLKNIVGNDTNDYSLQSEAWCSPCTRAIYNTHNCPTITGMYDFDGMPLPICIQFDREQVLGRMEEIYQAGIPRKQFNPEETRKVYM